MVDTCSCVNISEHRGYCMSVFVYMPRNMVSTTDLYKYPPDVIPPIHAVSYHVATDKPPAQDGDKFRSIFSDNLQPIATRAKKARGTLLVNQHCGNGCSIKRAPLSISYYDEISGGHIGWGLFGGGVLPAQYCPCGLNWQNSKIQEQFCSLSSAAKNLHTIWWWRWWTVTIITVSPPPSSLLPALHCSCCQNNYISTHDKFCNKLVCYYHK